MKTTKSFTIDVELWAKARVKYDNVSQRINELLRADLENEQISDIDTEDKIKNYQAAIASLKAEIEIKKQKEEKKKENLKPVFNPNEDRSFIIPEELRK